MSANKHLIALAVAVTAAVSQNAEAQEPAGDSAYQWGRGAVLRPAAGGQPYQAPLEPGADKNYRPGDYFDPVVQAAPPTMPPVVVPNPPVVVPNPPGNPPPVGGPRQGLLPPPPVVIPNPPGSTPPVGGPRAGLQ